MGRVLRGFGDFAPPTCCPRSRDADDERRVETKIDNLNDNQKKSLEVSLESWRARFTSGIDNNS